MTPFDNCLTHRLWYTFPGNCLTSIHQLQVGVTDLMQDDTINRGGLTGKEEDAAVVPGMLPSSHAVGRSRRAASLIASSMDEELEQEVVGWLIAAGWLDTLAKFFFPVAFAVFTYFTNGT